MKPADYHEQEHERCCGKCIFAGWQPNTHSDPMCYHGDDVETVNDSLSLEGDELSKWWCERLIHSEGICEKFSPGEPVDIRWSEPYTSPESRGLPT